MAIREQQTQTAPLQRAVTARSIVIGAMCAGFLGWGGHFTRHIAHTTKMAQDHLPWGAVVPFLLIAVVLNKVLEKVRPQWVLRPSELLVIFSMGLVASALPSYFMGHLIANVSAPFYFANTENRWADDIHPYLADWAVVTDVTAARWFFEGLPAGATIPWEIWITPMIWRLSLVFMIGVFGFCAVSILRKQWVEHERLTFPLMTIPTGTGQQRTTRILARGHNESPRILVGIRARLISHLLEHGRIFPATFSNHSPETWD